MAQLSQTFARKKWKTSFLSEDQKVKLVIRLFFRWNVSWMISGFQNVYSRAEGIADHYWPRPIFCCYYFTILDKEVFILLKPTMNSLRNIQEKYVIQDNSPSPQAVSELFDWSEFQYKLRLVPWHTTKYYLGHKKNIAW